MVARKKSVRKRPCCNCKARAAVSRDNCAPCLKSFWADVANGFTTEAIGVATGRIAAAKKPGRKPLKRRKLVKR